MKSQHNSHTHLQATQIRAQTKAYKRVCLSNRTADSKPDYRKEQRRHNSTYKKLAVQWLNEALCPALRDFVVAESLVLRNRQIL